MVRCCPAVLLNLLKKKKKPPKSIAWLSPSISEDEKREDKRGKYTWQTIQINILECIPPQGETKSDLRSRESTTLLEDEEDNTQHDTSYPRLQLPSTVDRNPAKGLCSSPTQIAISFCRNCRRSAVSLRSYIWTTIDLTRFFKSMESSSYTTTIDESHSAPL